MPNTVIVTINETTKVITVDAGPARNSIGLEEAALERASSVFTGRWPNEQGQLLRKMSGNTNGIYMARVTFGLGTPYRINAQEMRSIRDSWFPEAAAFINSVMGSIRPQVPVAPVVPPPSLSEVNQQVAPMTTMPVVPTAPGNRALDTAARNAANIAAAAAGAASIAAAGRRAAELSATAAQTAATVAASTGNAIAAQTATIAAARAASALATAITIARTTDIASTNANRLEVIAETAAARARNQPLASVPPLVITPPAPEIKNPSAPGIPSLKFTGVNDPRQIAFITKLTNFTTKSVAVKTNPIQAQVQALAATVPMGPPGPSGLIAIGAGVVKAAIVTRTTALLMSLLKGLMSRLKKNKPDTTDLGSNDDFSDFADDADYDIALPDLPADIITAVDAGKSSVELTPSSFRVNSGSTTVTVTARDSEGNRVSGVLVVLNTTGYGNNIIYHQGVGVTSTGMTDSNGELTADITSSIPGTKTVFATIDGLGITDIAPFNVTT